MKRAWNTWVRSAGLTSKAHQGSFQDAVDAQILAGHHASVADKLRALDDLFAFCQMIARQRGAEDKITLRADGSVWWSGAHERDWRRRQGDDAGDSSASLTSSRATATLPAR